MEDKSIYVANYITSIREKLQSMEISISEDQFNRVINRFINSSKSIEEIKKEIDELIYEFLKNYKLSQEENKKSIEPPKGIKVLKNLPVENIGITLNAQQIDLMMIAKSDTPIELQETLSKITQINETLPILDMNEEEFLVSRQKMFDKYISSLQSKQELSREDILMKGIAYLEKYGNLSNEQMKKVHKILAENSSIQHVIEQFNQVFDKNVAHHIFEIMRQYSPIAKVGVTKVSLQGYRNLYQEIIQNYTCITIDNEVKYNSVVLLDNTFDFRHLQKSLDFAKSINKGVKLNALCFYADFPSRLSNLEKNEENKQLVKETLIDYVDKVTKFISEYQQENGNVIKNIDVFNELLNIFQLSNDLPYGYRGDIPQSDKFDVNTFDGWQKYLDLEDLCKVISIARKNLTNTDIVFTYNEANLEDPKKVQYFKSILGQIQEYEQANGVKLIDSIGTQMHINSSNTIEQIRQELIELGKIGLPIEITEFDMMIQPEVSSNLTLEQIENMKQSKLNDFCDLIMELHKQVQLSGITIWSINDDQNFMIEVENQKLIEQGMIPNIVTLYGGYYSKDMLPRYEAYIKSRLDNRSFGIAEESTILEENSTIVLTSEIVKSFARQTEVVYEKENSRDAIKSLEKVAQIDKINPSLDEL